MRLLRRALSLCALALATAAGCGAEKGQGGSGKSKTPPQAGKCEAGLRQECACDFGTGMQDCAEDGSGWGQCLCPVTDVAYTPDAHPVDLHGDEAVEVTDTTVRIPRAGHDDVASLREGDILVHMGDPPLLRRILSRRVEGGTIVLETRKAGLTEAFERLRVHLKDAPVNVYGALPEQVRSSLESDRAGISGGAGGLSYGVSGSLRPELSFSKESSARFEPTIDFDAEVNLTGLKEFRLVAGLDTGLDLISTVGLTGQGSISAEAELIYYALKLAGAPPPYEIVVPLGSGLSISPKIVLGCELGVEGEVSVTSRVHGDLTIRGGVDYVRGREGDDWQVVDEASASAGAELLDWSYQASLGLRCYLQPRIELSFLEVVTGWAGVGPEATATLHFGRTNSFDVALGVTGSVGYSVGVDLGDVSITLLEDSYDLFHISRSLYYKEFSICGDGYRQMPKGETGEECDTGLDSDPRCVNCKCSMGYVPRDFDSRSYFDSDYQYGGFYNWCMLSCGNGVTEPAEGEVCDNYGIEGCNGAPGCSKDCKRLTGICGDGFVDGACGEVCDDGNTESCDGCDASCFFTDGCGNGMTNWNCGEQCDDGNTDDLDGCSNTCKVPFCGNGKVEPGEDCDDGNDDNCDACHNDCRTNEDRCGDSYVCPPEDCDHGSPADFWDCDADCTARVCGDGYTNPLREECDDANTNDCDGCHDDCTVNTPSCGDGHVCDAEECDEGGADTWTCDADCTLPSCGDGHTNPKMEACDDGDNDNCTIGCNAWCTGPVPPQKCGDNLTTCGEVCDEGPYNGMCGHCAADCKGTFGVCGDGVVDAVCGEVCDDTNTQSGDGCRGDCKGTEQCGDLLVDVGEVCDDGMPAACMGDCNSTCTAKLTGTCGDGTITPPCEVCEDDSPSGVDSGCTTSEPNCAACRRCSADVCGDGVQGPSEGCEVDRQCTPSENPCTTIADCLISDTACIPFYGEGHCDPTCTRVQTCGDGHLDGFEVCDDNNTLPGDGCNPTCTGP